ncbi:MAG: hypothetical protein ACAI43_13985 [Phycisphaerae bacterium]|nr:hypothetical protein [Tepidisphaeraceae bacterium]
MQLEQRIERLEAEYRWLRGVLTVALTVIGTAALMIGVALG